MLVKARNRACWKRKTNFSGRALFISRTRFPRCSGHLRLCVTTVRSSFILPLVYIYNLKYSSPHFKPSEPKSGGVCGQEPYRALLWLPSLLLVPLPLLRMNQEDMSVPSERLTCERACDRYHTVFTLYCKKEGRDTGSCGHFPYTTIVVFTEEGSFPLSFPRFPPRESDFINPGKLGNHLAHRLPAALYSFSCVDSGRGDWARFLKCLFRSVFSSCLYSLLSSWLGPSFP